MSSHSFSGEIRENLAALFGFAEIERYSIPALVRFWFREIDAAPRVAICGPVGSGASSLFSALTGLSVREQELLTSPVESSTHIDHDRWLFSDGTTYTGSANLVSTENTISVRQIQGPLCELTRISAAILGGMKTELAICNTADWLERVGAVILVSSAQAAMGNEEAALVRRLVQQHRPFIVVIDCMQNVSSDEIEETVREIEKYKLLPLQRETKSFPVVFRHPWKSIQEVDDKIRCFVRENAESAYRFQFEASINNWLKILGEEISRDVAKESLVRKRLDSNVSHLHVVTARLMDIFDKTILRATNDLEDLYCAVENQCSQTAIDYVAWSENRIGNIDEVFSALEEKWCALNVAVGGLLDQIEEHLSKEWLSQSQEFALQSDLQDKVGFLEIPLLSFPKFNTVMKRWSKVSWEEYFESCRETLDKLCPRLNSNESLENSPLQEKARNPEKKKMNREKFQGIKRTVEAASGSIKNIRTKANQILKTVVPTSSRNLSIDLAGALVQNLQRYVKPILNDLATAINCDRQESVQFVVRLATERWRDGMRNAIAEKQLALKKHEAQTRFADLSSSWRRFW